MEHLKRMAALIGTTGLLMLGGCASEEVGEETEESALASKSGTLDPTFGKGGRVVRGDAIPRAQDRVALGDRLVILQGESIRLYDPTLGFVSTFGEKGSIALSGLLAANESAMLRPRLGSGFYVLAARKDGVGLRVLAFGVSGVRDSGWGTKGELVVSGVTDGVLDGKGRLVLYGKSAPVRVGSNGKVDPTFVSADPRLLRIEKMIAEKGGALFAKLASGDLLRLREDGSVDAAFVSKGEKLVAIAERMVADEKGGMYLQGVDYLAHLKPNGAVDGSFANEIGNYSKVGERLDLTYDSSSKGLLFAFEYLASVGPFTKAGTLGVMKVDGTTGKRLSSFDKDGVTQFAFDQLEIDAASIRTDASGKLWVHANLFSDQSLSFGAARLWK